MRKFLPVILLIFFLFPLCANTSTHTDAENKNEYEKLFSLSIKHKEAGGVGYNTGYSSLQAYTAFRPSNRYLFLLDMQGHILNSGKLAGNIGIGLRKQMGRGMHAFGGNIYYDVRQTEKTSFQQLGFGLEFLSNAFDWRFNGYLPVGGDRHILSYQFQKLQPDLFYASQRFQVALTGFDTELGKKIGTYRKAEFYGAGSLYYFKKGSCSTELGGKLRLEASINRYVSIACIGSYDKLYKGNIQGQLSFHIPLYSKVKTEPKNMGYTYLNMDFFGKKPYRKDLIVLCEGQKEILAKVWMQGSLFHMQTIPTPFSKDTFGDHFVPIQDDGERTIETVIEKSKEKEGEHITLSSDQVENILTHSDNIDAKIPRMDSQESGDEEAMGYFAKFLEFIFEHIDK